MTSRIAIIDDDAQSRAAMEALLADNGLEPCLFASGAELASADWKSFDLFLIDLRLAQESGLDIAREIHIRENAPVIMFSGAGDDIDKIIGLEAGADDFLLKPFNPRELVARIRALLRRYRKTETTFESEEPAAEETIRFGDHTIDLSNRRLMRGNTEVVLTNAEFRLLEYLARNHDRVIDRVELLKHLRSDLSRYVDRTVDVLILRLRRKIEAVPSKPIHLQTRHGKGYLFSIDADPDESA